MQVGIYCSSNRPYLWGNLYYMLSQTNVDFNLCIAGPNPPIEPLPGNVKYIQTNVKPAQCSFIAANNTEGDYVVSAQDDWVLSPGYLDDLIKLADGRKTIIVSPYLARGDFTYKDEYHYGLWDARGYPEGDPRATYENRKYSGSLIPLNFPLPQMSFVHRETFNQIGIDKQHITTWFYLDMAMELVSKGGKTIISKTSYVYDFRVGKTSICQIPCDLFYLDDMWIDQATVGGADKQLRTTRKEPIDPLVYNETVLTVSQGKVHPPILESGGVYEAADRTNLGDPVRIIPPGWI